MLTNTVRWMALSFSQPVICGRMPDTTAKSPMAMPSTRASWWGLTRAGGFGSPDALVAGSLLMTARNASR